MRTTTFAIAAAALAAVALPSNAAGQQAIWPMPDTPPVVDGERWELHHMKPGDVPAEVEALARSGGEISAGDMVGRIYDAAEIGIEPHLHINVISPEGIYHNPLNRLPAVQECEIHRCDDD